ncbi:MAG TPA: DUF1552 domain-containing protein [Polyangiaceae bacterium]|jgi:hypothetical protein|nr:DUF1552 domain-containing protein [Polyangiaceae bacterium]
MNKIGLGRRRFLGGAASIVTLPWLASLAPRVASAHASTPKRFVAFYVPNGIHMAAWTPSSTGSDYELTPILAPLEPLKRKVLVVTGLANAPAHPDGPGDHAAGTAGFLTCRHVVKTDGAGIRNGTSVDQIAARAFGRATRIASLQYGIDSGSGVGNCDSGYSCAYVRNISWASESQPLPKITNPEAAFAALFDGADNKLSKAERERRRRDRSSVLDYVRGEATSLSNRLSVGDRQKLDEYLTGVRELEQRIQGVGAAACSAPSEPAPSLSYPEHVKLMLDLTVLALKCDATRVVSFMLGNGGSPRSYEFIGVHGGHHDISHHQKRPDNLEKLQKIDTWEVTQLAYLLRQMDAVNEGEGSLLDHSAVFFSSEIEDGDTHSHYNLPVLLAGSLGGAIPTGSHLRVSHNAPLGGLFLTLLSGLGVPAQRFGDDGTSPLALGADQADSVLGRPLQTPLAI